MIPNNGYYEVLIHKDLKKCIDKRKAPFNNDYILKAFQKKVEYLRTDCSHPSLNFKPYTVSEAIKRRKGVDDIYEFYVNKSIRCLVYILEEQKELILYYVGNHNDIKQKALK